MRLWKKWALGGMGGVVLIVFAARIVSGRRDRAEEHKKDIIYAKQIAEVRTEFPLGISVEDARTIAQAKNIGVGEAGNHLYLRLGSDPSHVWYCSNWITNADLTFDGSVENSEAKLKSIAKDIMGGDCL